MTPAHRQRLAPLIAACLLGGGCSTAVPAADSGTAPASRTQSQSAARKDPPVTSAARPYARPAGSQSGLDESLRKAAWANDVRRARRLVARGADVNAKDGTQQSAYLIAASEGYAELVDLALDHGARVDDKDGWNGTALIRAAERGHAEVVGRLLRTGIARDHVNRIGYQAIHEGVWLGEDTSGYVDTVRVLAAGGVELSRRSAGEGMTPLQMAAGRGYTRLHHTLRTLTRSVRIADADSTLLHAATTGDADRAALALRAGADLETRDGRGRSPLLLAATHDHVAVARLLVWAGADPDALDDRHDTPWLVTGVTGSVPMLEALLPAGPDLGIENRFGGLSVIPASERGHVEYVRRVVRTGIDVDHVNRLGWTALLEAVILGDGGKRHQEVARILLNAGADPSITDHQGMTALEHARARGQTRLARILG
jgi:uncharacterized protein